MPGEGQPPATVVAFHAHPDDETILTGGTLARAAAAGHRVVLVVATDGSMGGPAASGESERMGEVRRAAEVLGVHRVEHLGYADSGHGPDFYPDPPGRVRFARAELEEAAGRLAELLREERAELLLSYQANGGYGHRDHCRVHEVGRRAAELAGTPRVLETTMPRELLLRGLAFTQRLRLPFMYDADVVPTAYSPQAEITHVVDVRSYVTQKRRAFAAHRSQLGGNRFERLATLAGLRVPSRIAGRLIGREWYVEPGAQVVGTPRPWIFDG